MLGVQDKKQLKPPCVRNTLVKWVKHFSVSCATIQVTPRRTAITPRPPVGGGIGEATAEDHCPSTYQSREEAGAPGTPGPPFILHGQELPTQ